MECDLGYEFLGQNQFPYAQVEYVQALVRHAIAMNASGIVARIERSCLASEAGGTCVVDQPATTILGTMNEVTLDALTAAVANATISPSQVYIDFATRSFGADAAPYVRRAFELSFDAVNRAYYPLRQWFTMQHSNVPSSWKYVNECLDPDGYAANFVWIPSPTEVIFNRQLRKPTFGDVAIINAELDIADTLSLSALRAAQQASILLKMLLLQSSLAHSKRRGTQ